MTADLRATSPLAAFVQRFQTARRIALVEHTLVQIDLRGDASDPAFRAAVRGVVGLDVPVEPNAVAEAGHRAILWLGPDEWLVVEQLMRGDDPPALAAPLAQALAGWHASVVDVSSNRAVIGLAGPHARKVLAKGCGLDLHPRSFAAGRCAQTLLGRAQVILHQTSDTPTYRLHVRASFAAYLAAWLLDAVREYV